MNTQQRILENILTALDKVSTADYQNYVRPEYSKNIMPFNPFSEHHYTGTNKLSLMIYNIFGFYKSNLYGTFKQITQAGGKLRKGSKSVDVTYYNAYMYDAENKKRLSFSEHAQLPEKEQQRYTKKTTAKVFKVFNFDYVTNADTLELPEPEYEANEIERNEQIDLFIEQTDVHITYVTSDFAYYNIKEDKIAMPQLDAYTSTEAYYAALLHELIHWSGHKNRLNRETVYTPNSNTTKYAEEELIAEMGSLLLYTSFDLYEQFASSCAYIKSYYKHVNNDIEVMYKAFTEAQKAQRFLNECNAVPKVV